MTTAIQRLLAVIGYPAEDVSAGRGVVAIKVDGQTVRVSEENGRLLLACPLEVADDQALSRFARYAAGRLLKEDATLAWDPRSEELILWQGVPASSGDGALKRVFEVFMASSDWWLGRAKENVAGAQIPEMMIRP